MTNTTFLLYLQVGEIAMQKGEMKRENVGMCPQNSEIRLEFRGHMPTFSLFLTAFDRNFNKGKKKEEDHYQHYGWTAGEV